jgi:hypothetical protein
MVVAAEAQFPPKAKGAGEASRASSTEDGKLLTHTQARAMDCQPRKRGRKPVVTTERVQMICELLARGESERSASIRAGIGLTAWNVAKRSDASLRERIASARDYWARLRHQRRAVSYASLLFPRARCPAGQTFALGYSVWELHPVMGIAVHQ